jgi:hypothetical protein
MLAPWDVLAEGITPIAGAAVFAKATSTSITMSFAIDAGDQKPVLVSSAASSNVTARGSVPCFS